MFEPGRRVHFIGIGGAGMSSIARVLLEMGLVVTGSDISSNETTKELSRRGAHVFVGHQAQQVEGADVVVISTAIGAGNPEVVAAEALGLPVLHRSEALSALMGQGKGIAVAGAHGKTTITSMVALVLFSNGLDPTVFIGGELEALGGGARYGRGEWVVAEADESDRSFLRYYPHIAVVTSIEADHLEFYQGSFQEMISSYRAFLGNLGSDGLAILAAKDQILMEMVQDLPARTLTYGLGQGDLQARDLHPSEGGSHCQVFWGEEYLGELSLRVPGEHNVENALATVAIGLEAGLAFEQIAQVLAQFRGAKRRFEIWGEYNGGLVVDDYAHHPTEIMATLRAARRGWPERKIWAVFQPHRYTRTFYLQDEFVKAFPDADQVLISEIYSPPGESPIAGVSGQALAQKIQSHLGTSGKVRFVPTLSEMVDLLAQEVGGEDLVLTMGAGSVWQVARDLVRRGPND